MSLCPGLSRLLTARSVAIQSKDSGLSQMLISTSRLSAHGANGTGADQLVPLETFETDG